MGQLQDAGEFIPGAKKHSAVKRGPKPVVKNRLQELWPEPDWLELSRQQRYAPHTLAALAITYWGLGTGPIKRGAFGLTADQWPKMYDKAIATIQLVFEEASNETLNELRRRAEELSGMTGRKDEPVLQKMALLAAGKFGGRTLYSPFSARERMYWFVSCMADLGWPENNLCLKTGIGLVKRTTDTNPELPNWRVAHCAKNATYIDGLDWMPKQEAIEAAHKTMQTRIAANAKESALLKAVTKRGSVEKFERVGPDYLKGQNISAQMLIDTFKFRGVQFGESLTDKERQQWMNEAYSALHDLAQVLKFSPAWIGLGGKGRKGLGLAIGARGQSAAMAHYEPRLAVINLTREKGVGNLAHEWFHALDHTLCMGALKESFHFSVHEQAFFSNLIEYANPKRSSRANLINQFVKFHSVLDYPSPMYQQAKRIEGLKRARKRYWTDSTEMWARCFEAFIEDALAAQNLTSPWLVYGTTPEQQPDHDLSPYPIGEQRHRLNELLASCMHLVVNPNG